MQHREPFWLVWNPQGYNPQRKHNTEEGATREAERLARANPGQTFIVMESVGALVVAFVPARVDTNWWHNYAAKATEVRFPKGRVKFAGATASAPFPVAVIVFRPKL